MTDNAGQPYQIIGTPIHQDRWNDTLQTVESGWKVTVKWLATGTVIPLFVPDAADLVSTVDQLARFQGAQLDALHA